jgi:hypothetical protein
MQLQKTKNSVRFYFNTLSIPSKFILGTVGIVAATYMLHAPENKIRVTIQPNKILSAQETCTMHAKPNRVTTHLLPTQEQYNCKETLEQQKPYTIKSPVTNTSYGTKPPSMWK